MPSPRNRVRLESCVLLWEHQPSRIEPIAQIVAQCGAQVHRLESLSALENVEYLSHLGVALVALGTGPSRDAALQVTALLKQKGLKTICYEDGAQSWSLGTRCQALLVGASSVIDSADQGFAPELRSLLTRLLQAEREREQEEEEIKSTMRKLGMVGESPAMVSVFRWVLRVSPLSDLPAVITGETGTGKELVARAVHHLDPKRSRGPFVALNCGAISPGLAESQLFGHRRGAFTSANEDRRGLVRAAQGGVLFLDEIGEMEISLQTKLLRVLQENRVLGVGEEHEVAVNVRLLAASNRDLEQMVQKQEFRADFFHRINVLSVRIPSLRERPADIQPLVEHCLQRYGSFVDKRCSDVDPDFVEALRQLQLPGNARELENLVRRAFVNKEDDRPLRLSDLPANAWEQLSRRERTQNAPPDIVDQAEEAPQPKPTTLRQENLFQLDKFLERNGWNLSSSLRDCEKLLLQTALHVAHGNQTQTARLLGITPRSVYNKLRKYHLHPE